MDDVHFSVLFVLGLSLSCGLVGAWVFQRLRVPQVVGYIVIGLIVGQSGLNLIDPSTVARMEPFTLFALGIIGFLVGGELRAEQFRKYGRQFMAILFGEGLGAFVLVGLGAGAVLYVVFGRADLAVAGGVVFGAIASATDPASTVDVLWEYRARGVLTTSLTAIVALDDALAMTLYGLGTGLAEVLTGHSGSIGRQLLAVGGSLGGAVVLGAAVAMILWVLLRRIHQPDRALAFAVGLILLLISIAAAWELDVILASMTLGCVLVNTSPRRSEDLFKVMRSFSIPIYVLFFVLAGARLGLGRMPGWLWGIVALYVVGRGAGKIAGAAVAARFSGCEPVVRRWLGVGLFSQGGVAIGLSIVASHHLGGVEAAPGVALADVVVAGVAATTLVLQLSGPALVKVAIKAAGEAGRNVTVEDVIDEWTVADGMGPECVVIPEQEPLSRAIRTFVDREQGVYPVVDHDGRMVGVLTFDVLQNVLLDQHAWTWLLASDVAAPVQDRVFPDQPLREAMELMRQVHADHVPVVSREDPDRPVGILSRGELRRRLGKELIQREHPGDVG